MKFVLTQPSEDRAVQVLAAWLARQLQEYGRPVRILFHDGTTVQPEHRPCPSLTLVLRTRTALVSMFRLPLERSLGESYVFGDVDVVGDFQEVFPLAEYFLAKKWTLLDRLRFMWHHVTYGHSRPDPLPVDRRGGTA